jgi:hypothetical protein
MSTPDPTTNPSPTRTILARRVNESHTLLIDNTPFRVDAVESVGYGPRPDQTTLYAGMHTLHFWYDETVTIIARRP